MFSKKGNGYILGKKPVYFIIVLFFLTASFLLFGFIILTSVSNSNTIPPNTKITIMINRFLNSPECFAYMDDETGRVYPGIVDLKKLNDNQIAKCYNGIEGSTAFQFKIEELNIICETPN
ncbi:MAG: hypothetical protein PHV16_01265, partial [Candidatus Nanoarchaeia archaeon]|nr:hypothetical protein [Candidatus Nanoarchaeia archaeon]